jgi:hypothetical protein
MPTQAAHDNQFNVYSKRASICQITAALVTIQLQITALNVAVPVTFATFQVEEEQSVLLSDSNSFEVSRRELKSGVLQEMPQRRAVVEILRQTMVQKGATQIGRGDAWFNYRFRC